MYNIIQKFSIEFVGATISRPQKSIGKADTIIHKEKSGRVASCNTPGSFYFFASFL
jgi:hypothetical protein